MTGQVVEELGIGGMEARCSRGSRECAILFERISNTMGKLVTQPGP